MANENISSEIKAEEFPELKVETSPSNENAAASIIKDIQEQSANILPEANSPEIAETSNNGTVQNIGISERECVATLAAVYQLVAFAMNTESVSEDTINLRGSQFYIISQRYGMNIKYLDLIFFGIGISSDMIIMYKNRTPTKKELEEQNKKEMVKPEDKQRIENLPKPLGDLESIPKEVFGV